MNRHRVEVQSLGPGAGVAILVLNHAALSAYTFLLWLELVRALRVGLLVLTAVGARIARAGERPCVAA